MEPSQGHKPALKLDDAVVAVTAVVVTAKAARVIEVEAAARRVVEALLELLMLTVDPAVEESATAPLGRRRAELGGGRHLIYGAVKDNIRLAAFGLCCGHG